MSFVNLEKKSYCGDKLCVDFYSEFLPEQYANNLFLLLEKNVPWPNPKKIRTNANFGIAGTKYTFEVRGNVITREVIDWKGSIFESLGKVIAKALDLEDPSYVVVQRYIQGKLSGIVPHKDNELRKGTPIVGISLGGVKSLVMSRFSSSIKIELNHGSMYVIKDETNEYWKHQILENVTDLPRISLTYRWT